MYAYKCLPMKIGRASRACCGSGPGPTPPVTLPNCSTKVYIIVISL